MGEAQPGQFHELSAGTGARILAWLRERNEVFRVLDLVACFIVASSIVFMSRSEGDLRRVPLLKEGDVAPVTVRAPRTMEIEDKEATELEKARVLEKVSEVYDFDSEAVQAWADRWKRGIRYFRHNRPRENSMAERVKMFEEKLGVEVSESEYKLLESMGFSGDLERSVVLSLAPLWDARILQETHGPVRPIELVNIHTQQGVIVGESDLKSFVSLDQARVQVGRAALSVAKGRLGNVKIPWTKWSQQLKTKIFSIQSRLVTANVTLNRRETEARREAGLKNLKRSFRRLEKGEVIVREGERVSRQDANMLLGLHETFSSQTGRRSSLPSILLGTFVAWLLIFTLRKHYPSLLVSGKDAFVAAFLLVSSLASLKLAIIFQIQVLSETFSSFPESLLIFMIPVATPAMVLRLLVGAPLTLLFTAIHALAVSVVVGKASIYGLYVFVSCLMGAHFLGRCRTRSHLYRAGLGVAVVCGVGAALLVLVWRGQIPFSGVEPDDVMSSALRMPSQVLWAFVGGLAGGWLSSALTLVLVPIFESLLNYTTDLKLLELARMDHPLLRDLVLKAPGTYHHSIIVGSLVEAGAEAIGANALLARVGAYYHDIGKVGRAEYFVENQGGGRNPHDFTTPQLSAKIIISHVKEGILMAQQYKLGQSIIDFIQTHHGTGVVSFFYNKAKQEAAQPGSSIQPDEVSEEEFRYPGPRPQSRECALVALADACEAATRSLVEPTPARLEGMVNKILMKAFTEGLLEESQLTIEELRLAGKAFLRILLGIHHHRIQYPDQEKGLPPKTPLTALKSSQG